MLLTIDIGNTNITLGLYPSDQLDARWRIATNHERMPDEYGLQFLGMLEHAGLSYQDVDGICMASVVPPLTGKIKLACLKYLGQEPLVVDAGVKTGVRILYDNPRSVGADRIVDAAAVGAIAPGIGIAAEALFMRAAKLPRVELLRPPSAIGKNTTHAMQSGLLFGYVSLVEGMVARFRQELGNEMKVIATGGLAEVIAQETNSIEIIAPWLTLDGLRIIWKLNQSE